LIALGSARAFHALGAELAINKLNDLPTAQMNAYYGDSRAGPW
jgi:hypothetical protein